MSEPESIVFVVDDDPSVRSAIKRLIGSVGLQVELFGSGQEFLQASFRTCPVAWSSISGCRESADSRLQRQLAEANVRIPIIFVTAHSDVPMTVRALKAGAVEFLTKPFGDQDLLDAIHLALERDRGRRQQDAELAVLRERFELLSPREREVVAMVVSGMLNKQIAAQIGTAENTVKVHRSRAMEKMQANSLADLIKMIERLQVPRGNIP